MKNKLAIKYNKIILPYYASWRYWCAGIFHHSNGEQDYPSGAVGLPVDEKDEWNWSHYSIRHYWNVPWQLRHINEITCAYSGPSFAWRSHSLFSGHPLDPNGNIAETIK